MGKDAYCKSCGVDYGRNHLDGCPDNDVIRGSEAVDNAIGGHGIDVYGGEINSPLPDVMVGVNVPEGNRPAPIIDQGLNSDSATEGNHPDDAFEVWIYQKVGGGYTGGVQARGPSAEDAFLFAFTEMNDAPTRPVLPDRDTEEYYQRIYQVLSRAFTELLQDGYDAIEINASACGMARRSMEQLVGKDKAIAWDNFVRKNIGWDKAKARIIYPDQVVKGRRGKS